MIKLNNKGQMVMVGFMIALTLIIATIAVIGPMKDMLTEGKTTMGCSTPANLSVGDNAVCIITDWSFPAFVGMCIAVAVSWLGLKQLGVIQQ